MFSADRLQLRQPQDEDTRDQRKHIRIEHGSSIQLVGEGRRFSGQAVNISRSGMQVVVNLPDSHESVRSITFTLPNADHAIELPCRIVRSESNTTSGRSDILGLEFSFQGEAQLLLIENYIREMKQGQLFASDLRVEMRQIPRTRCTISDVNTNRDDIQILSIDNISADGMLVSFTGNLQPSEKLSMKFFLPDDSKQVTLSGQVVYVIENEFRREATAGIRLIDMGHVNESRIRNFIITCHSTYAFKHLCDNRFHGDKDGEYRVADECEIYDLLEKVAHERIPLNVLATRSLRIYEVKIIEVNRHQSSFEIDTTSESISEHFTNRSTTYCSFILGGGSYFFKTVRDDRISSNRIVFSLPETVFHTEKRSYQRKFIEFSSDVDLFISNGLSEMKSLSGELVDISRRGFLCQVTIPWGIQRSIRPGDFVRYRLDSSLGLGEEGEIRHIEEVSAHNRRIVLQLGIEAGIKRRRFKYHKVVSDKQTKSEQRRSAQSFGDSFRTQTIPVRYYNSRQHEIRGLVNTSSVHTKAPVVVIPPAFGKKKEALSPFVTTLLYNFSLHNKEITVIRYDGVNRPGESYREKKHCKRGYEMLHYKVSQGLDDLKTTLDYVVDNPYFDPTEVILLTFSMSAIDARKFLSTYHNSEYPIKLWISCMGVACAQSTIGNILAGIDIISNYKQGIPNGIHGMLGHILDMDRVAKDLVEKKYAYMTDARHDMSNIGIPVMWIYGQHDKWVRADEVHDIMSVESDAPREVIELTAGHNLRTSDDAIHTFGLITSRIYETLFNERIESLDPPKREILRLISYERERLTPIQSFEKRTYWRSYLMGEGHFSSGYDFYINIKVFRDFLKREIDLLQVENGNRIADMGCGTGLVLEALLNEYTSNGHGHYKLDIEAVEIVPEALEKTKKKCEPIILSSSKLNNVRIRYKLADLEPNRFAPVSHFIIDTKLDFDYLRNKIKGLRNTTIDSMLEFDSPELYRVLRGADFAISARWLIDRIHDKDLRSTIAEFNRAARFIRRNLTTDDLVLSDDGCTSTQKNRIDYQSLTAKHLGFEILDFGDCGLNPRSTFPSQSYDRIIASLLLSYLFNGEYLLSEFYRILKPGGLLLVSSMKPDSDLSTIFTDYIGDVETAAQRSLEYGEMNTRLTQARLMLNEAADLFELEEDGYFHFYSADELAELLNKYGFENVTVNVSLGNPSQAVIVTGKKPYIE